MAINNEVFATMAWSNEVSIPQDVGNARAVVLGDLIYLVGGQFGNGNLNTLYVYDTVNKVWSKKANIPVAIRQRAVAYADNKIYAIGGYNVDPAISRADVNIYDVAANSWTNGASLPVAVRAAEAVAYDNTIYVVGGNSNNNGNYLQMYDISSNTWTTTPLGFSIESYTLNLYDGKLYVIGGLDPDNNVLVDEVKIYDIATGVWSTGTSMSTPKANHASALVDGKIYIMGGRAGNVDVDESDSLDDVEIYDIATDSWSTGVSLTAKRRASASAVIDDTIYIIGANRPTEMGRIVQSLNVAEDPIDPEKLRLLLYVGEQQQLSVSHNLPDNLIYYWSSTDPSIATVDMNGIVTGVSAGLCDIVVQSNDGSYSEIISVIVKRENPRLAVHLVEGETAQLYLVEDPLTVIWTSLDTSIVTVSNTGEITGIGKGFTMIQAVIDGRTYFINVRVNPVEDTL